jgi:signal transduction histidine kinase
LVPILLPAKFTAKTLVAGNHGDIWVGGLSLALAQIVGNTWKMMEPSYVISYGSRDSRGIIWLLVPIRAPNGVLFCQVLRLENGKLTVAAQTRDVSQDFGFGTVLALDREDTVWLGAGPRDLFFLKNGRWEQFETPPEVAGKRAQVTFTDAAGRVWFGFSENTILRMDGKDIRTFSAKDGLQVGSGKAITGRDRHIWIGGEDGLAAWEEGRFRAVVPADRDEFRGVSGIQEDSGGNLFLSEQRGVVFIPATEVSKTLRDPTARVHYQLFDVRDGLPGVIQQSGPYPTAVQGTDGRVWFSTSTGVVWIDPSHIQRNALAPPVVIRSITTNGTRYNSPAGLRLPPSTRDLTIDYTALSLAIPERVRFRYKLEGSDTDWQEAGTRRQAFYTNLSPGKYRFQVTASNNDGVWNEAGASLSFGIAPTFYQMLWFQTLLVLAGIGLIWLLYRIRLQQITARADLRYAERLEERARIARELHDTMLQSFQASLAQMQAARNLFSRRSDRALENLDDAISMAAGAIAEGRNAVGDLRSSTPIRNDLAEALKAVGGELAAGGAATFQLVVQGLPRELHPVMQDEIYGIGGEALRNAFRHSGAQHIEVDVRYSEQLLRLQIRDDGVGINPEILEGGRSNHYGLVGIRERAQKIGAKLEIWSAAGTGTEVGLSVPASRAYRTSAPRVRWRLFTRE